MEENGDTEKTVLSDKSTAYANTSNFHALKNTKYNAERRVAYIYCDEYLKQCDLLPKVPSRARLVHSLIQAYGLLKKVRLIAARPARIEEIELFHSSQYVQFLQELSKAEDEEKYDEEAEQYGLTFDCPAWPGVFDYAAFVVGGSLKAAQCLVMGIADIAINWPGGWHHAKRDEASGFCYFNDIVIAILTLRKKFERVLYIDLDLHHGDGVEDAFCATAKVFTLSFHKVSPGFFPGTGKLSDTGIGKGKHYTLNVPIKDGIQDDQYFKIVKRVCDLVHEIYNPMAVVCQCGADGLYGDPMESYNLTPKALTQCVQHIKNWKLPLLLVGGGGYNLPNTARCWAQITATVLGETLSDDIPEHENFVKYGPDFGLDFQQGNRPDKNDESYVQNLFGTINDKLKKLQVVE